MTVLTALNAPGELAAVRIGDGRAIRVHRAAVADLLEPVVPGKGHA